MFWGFNCCRCNDGFSKLGQYVGLPAGIRQRWFCSVVVRIMFVGGVGFGNLWVVSVADEVTRSRTDSSASPPTFEKVKSV
jgi:hypothetical protein